MSSHRIGLAQSSTKIQRGRKGFGARQTSRTWQWLPECCSSCCSSAYPFWWLQGSLRPLAWRTDAALPRLQRSPNRWVHSQFGIRIHGRVGLDSGGNWRRLVWGDFCSLWYRRSSMQGQASIFLHEQNQSQRRVWPWPRSWCVCGCPYQNSCLPKYFFRACCWVLFYIASPIKLNPITQFRKNLRCPCRSSSCTTGQWHSFATWWGRHVVDSLFSCPWVSGIFGAFLREQAVFSVKGWSGQTWWEKNWDEIPFATQQEYCNKGT